VNASGARIVVLRVAGVIEPGTPYEDSDRDGMADGWERTRRLNPNSPSDNIGDDDGDGYTNVEEFLNGTHPKQSNSP